MTTPRGFKSYGTCESFGRNTKAIYGGVHYGAVLYWECDPDPTDTCPPGTAWALYVKYNIDQSSPHGIAPNAAPSKQTALLVPNVGLQLPTSTTVDQVALAC
ncbi:MAG: hypothetical protein ABWY33_02940 [Cellulomonas sp.]